jgi:hypothetical protein
MAYKLIYLSLRKENLKKMENKEEAVERTEHGNNMMSKLIEIRDLIALLGYVDERSIESWCKKNKVPLIHIGKKTYTLNSFIDLFINQKLEQFIKANYKNFDEILKAVYDDNKTDLSKLINAPLDKESSSKFKAKKNSKAADDFIKKLKAA